MDNKTEFTSDKLMPDTVYTREDLKSLFGITDATINNGVFRPKGTASVWLFITEEKTSDRTQYRDRLDGDTLHWQGQTSSRTDPLIIEHQTRGLELLIFLRKKKYEYPGAGFRYLGPFLYGSHSGHGPTSFTLRRYIQARPIILPEEADDAAFDPSSIQDARRRVLRTIAQRRGQRAFRDALIKAYGGRCAITECSILDVLEAAHISPYLGPETNNVMNGLLLRADLHTLFDCGLVAIDSKSMTVVMSPPLRDSEYGAFYGRRLLPPQNPRQRPSIEALDIHRISAGL